MRLAADIGATKALFGLFDPDRGRPEPIFVKKYASKSFAGAAELLSAFLRDCPAHCPPESIRSACLALAGTREGSVYSLVNLGWTVDPQAISALLPADCALALVNDMEALAASLPVLAPEQLEALRPGRRGFASLGILAPGTGLGVAFVLDGRVHPSEGGHGSFAPGDAREVRLWEYLHGLYGHVSAERVLSGEGLRVLARFMALEDGGREGDVPGDSETIAQKARDGACPRCAAAAEQFARTLGREAGRLALTVLPRDGIVLAGGIPPALLPFLRSEAFERAFLDQGRFSRWMEGVPVSVLLDPAAALLGAAVLAGGNLESTT